MVLREFLKTYGNGACISIEGYCEGKRYDYLELPDENEEDFSGNNPNGYVPRCLAKESWYEEVKDRKIKRWNIIGGGGCRVELTIELE